MDLSKKSPLRDGEIMIKSAAYISNRVELFDVLDQQMNNAYSQVRDIGALGRERAYVKTYLLEFDWNPERLGQSEVSFLMKSLTLPPTRKRKSASRPTITETLEEGFYHVEWKTGHANSLVIYLDTKTDDKRRFWIAYSLSDAGDIDLLLDRLTMSRAELDRVWLWPDFLRTIQARGEFRGIGMDYDYRRFEIGPQRQDSTNYLKFQIWGGKETERILDYIDENPEFGNKVVLSKVRMKYWQDKEDRKSFSIEDIKYNGKFTTRGTSFSDHQSLVVDVRSIYEDKIFDIEKKHTISYMGSEIVGGVEGDPVIFDFSSSPIEDLDIFCGVVFSGHQPFRLWGLARKTSGGDDGRLISAVDLHTGSKLSFEVYPDSISMYLHPGSCGNTVSRFYTNIQQTFSRKVISSDIYGKSIF